MRERFEELNIYGVEDAEQENALRSELAERFEQQEHAGFAEEERKDLLASEVTKSPEIEEFIQKVNGALRDYLGRLGVAFEEIPPENVHIIADEAIGRTLAKKYNLPLAWFSAVYEASEQSIYVKQSTLEEGIFLAQEIILHEMIHMAASQSFEVDSELQRGIQGHRQGFTIHSSKLKRHVFHEFNEALTQHTTEKVFATLFPESRIPAHAYEFEGKLLNYVMEEIFKKNDDQFENVKEVYDVFTKGYFDGSILEPIRLIRTTFGENGLRLIWSSGTNEKGAKLSFDVQRTLERRQKMKDLFQQLKHLLGQ